MDDIRAHRSSTTSSQYQVEVRRLWLKLQAFTRQLALRQ
uniref:Integrase n=1 Tax=Plectus sambesii TaxID=2011161 RepID=A0A914VL10_9BILA